jgi:Fe-S-cluster containining protein
MTTMSDPDAASAYLESLEPLAPGERFRFGCHPGVACFNECCADLNLELSPYDVLRLRAALDVPSRELLARHARVAMESESGFPRLFLRMLDDERKSCPFVSPDGCTVYADRPGACRTYPLGRGASMDARARVTARYVIVREDHCKGFDSPSTWTINSWLEDQGLEDYNAFNDRFLRVHARWKQRGSGEPKAVFATVLLALYQLDELGALLRQKRWLDQLPLEKAERTAILEEEPERLRFALDWLDDVLERWGSGAPLTFGSERPEGG